MFTNFDSNRLWPIKWQSFFKIQLFIFFFPVCISNVSSQAYPVTISIAVSPPYTSKVYDYIGDPNKLMATITNISSTQREVYLLGTFTDEHDKINIYTDPGFIMAEPIILQPGNPFRINQNNLNQIFDANHLVYEGITKNEILYKTGLPEGDWTICLDAYDFKTGQRLSAEYPLGCSNTFTVTNLEPPVILQPVEGSTIASSETQSISFVWTRPPSAPPQISYTLRIFDVLPGTRNINDAVASGILPLFFETSVNVNSFILGPAGPALVQGQKYAVLVTAIDPANKVNFRNYGNSPVSWFIYAGIAYPVSVSITVAPPFTSMITDYIGNPDKLMVTITNTSSSQREVYLMGMFLDDEHKINIHTDPGFIMAEPIILQPGNPFRLNPNNLNQIFDVNHLVYEGIAKEQDIVKTGLPEGEYTICLGVFDFKTGRRLSAEYPIGCSNTFQVTGKETPSKMPTGEEQR